MLGVIHQKSCAATDHRISGRPHASFKPEYAPATGGTAGGNGHWDTRYEEP